MANQIPTFHHIASSLGNVQLFVTLYGQPAYYASSYRLVVELMGFVHFPDISDTPRNRGQASQHKNPVGFVSKKEHPDVTGTVTE